MFDWLFKRKKSISISDIVWLNDRMRDEGVIQWIQKNNPDVIVAWLPETIRRMQSQFTIHQIRVPIQKMDDLAFSSMEGKRVLLLEHHSSFQKENPILENWNAASITVAVSLDEPLMIQFGADKIKRLMIQMGMQEHEHIEHRMISQSIQRAQKRFDEL